MGGPTAQVPPAVEQVAAETRKFVKETLDRAIRTFNVNPKRGVKFFTGAASSGMVAAADPAALADFIFTTRGLNKEKVKAWAGGRKGGV
jgi:hypothetical protein